MFVIIQFENYHLVSILKFWRYGYTKHTFAAVFYGCEMWSLKLRKEHKFKTISKQNAEANIWT